MSKIIALTLAIIAAATVGQAYHLDTQQMVQLDLQDLLRSSSDAMQKNPQLTSQCFGYYEPQIQKTTDMYKTKLNNCYEKTANAKEEINKDFAPDVEWINSQHSNICSSYSACSMNKNDVAAVFQCYGDAASQAMSVSYEIETKSKAKSTEVSKRIGSIKFDETRCVDDCDDEYKRVSAGLYQDLQDCMSGKITPPPSTQSTTTEIPTEPIE